MFNRPHLATRFVTQWSLNIALVGLSVAATAAIAQPAAVKPAAAMAGTEVTAAKPLASKLTQMLVRTGADGKEKLEAAGSVKPGDVIEYRVTYTNTGKQPIKEVLAVLPIPLETEYLPKTAKPGAALVTAATLSGVYAAEPLMFTPAGKAKAEPVPYADYRNLRWTLGQLPAGGATEVTARVKVITSVPPVVAVTAAPVPGSSGVAVKPLVPR